MAHKRITRDNLNDVMEFDHVIEVHPDGSVTDSTVYPPELDGETVSDGWVLLTGYSGQYRYTGPIMHPSEYIGGGMADDILARPGRYVALVVYAYDESEPDGWIVAYQEME